MKSINFLTLALILFAVPSVAQTLPVTFAWDASLSGPGPADNPVKYKLCTSATAPPYTTPMWPADRVCTDAGVNLQQLLQMTVGVKYVFATAYNFGVSSDGVINPSVLQESGPSNVLRIEVFAPPGRPDKIRIKSVTQAMGTVNGQTTRVLRQQPG